MDGGDMNKTIYVKPKNEGVWKEAEQLANAWGLSMSEVIAEALDNLIKEEEKNEHGTLEVSL
jgi:hypothetical protein